MININPKDLKKEIGNVSYDQIKEAFFDFGMEVKGESLDEETKETIWEVEIKPDRTDMISLHGIARALKAFLEIKPGIPKYEVKKSDYKIIIDPSVKKVRPYTVAAVVKGLKFDDKKIKEIINVQEKLHQAVARSRKRGAIGIYPMESIKWPITFKADKPKNIKFLPLEAEKEMNGLEILQKHPTGKDYAHLLEGKEVFPFFIDSNNEILSMPPIINSEKTGRITEKTKDIFIECSGFDKEFLSSILNILVTMFSDIGGEIYSVSIEDKKEKIKENYPNLESYEMEVNIERANKLIGFKITPKQAEKLLKKMMYEITSIKGSTIKVKIPKIRTDIWHEIDIIDDLARAYGFNNLEPTFPNVSTIGETLPLSDLKEKISELLVGLGFLEAYTFALTSTEDQYKRMNLDPKKQKYISIKDSAENGINMVRTWIIPELLKSFRNNMNNSLPQKIFEVGFIVEPNEKQDVKSKNIMKLAVAITNNKLTFTEIKQILDNLSLSLGIYDKLEIEETKHDSFIEGRSGKIILNKKEIGIIGEINPLVLENWGLVNPIVVFELDLEEILKII